MEVLKEGKTEFTDEDAGRLDKIYEKYVKNPDSNHYVNLPGAGSKRNNIPKQLADYYNKGNHKWMGSAVIWDKAWNSIKGVICGSIWDGFLKSDEYKKWLSKYQKGSFKGKFHRFTQAVKSFGNKNNNNNKNNMNNNKMIRSPGDKYDDDENQVKWDDPNHQNQVHPKHHNNINGKKKMRKYDNNNNSKNNNNNSKREMEEGDEYVINNNNNNNNGDKDVEVQVNVHPNNNNNNNNNVGFTRPRRAVHLSSSGLIPESQTKNVGVNEDLASFDNNNDNNDNNYDNNNNKGVKATVKVEVNPQQNSNNNNNKNNNQRKMAPPIMLSQAKTNIKAKAPPNNNNNPKNKRNKKPQPPPPKKKKAPKIYIKKANAIFGDDLFDGI